MTLKAEFMILTLLFSCEKVFTPEEFCIQKEPLFFKFEKGRNNELFPTVYLLWQYPMLLKVFTTHPPVVAKLQQGADLMLPGIEVNEPITPRSYGRFEKGTLVAINTSDNAFPFAIGNTAHSSMDMYMAARHGKGVIILHVYSDHLWQMGSKSPIPIMIQAENIFDIDSGGHVEPNLTDENFNGEIENLTLNEEEYKLSEKASKDIPELSESEAMDELFLHCFLKAWKTSAKKVEFPLLTSNFYRLHMVAACPSTSTLEIKKSSYKKLSKFLNEMAKKGLIEVKEFPKGVENITGVNYAHEFYKNFVVDEKEIPEPVVVASTANTIFTPPTLEELYQVSGTTVQFFRKNGLGKGDVLSRAEVRDIVTAYIEKNNLKRDEGKVELDSILHQAVVGPKEGYKETLRWDEIFSRLLGKMSSAFRISRPGQVPIIKKGKLEPIELAIAKRTGNKKVTFIYNAGVFGIDENDLAHQVQVGVATSTSVGPAENRPQGTTQILIQGNQVNFVAKLLLETYNIPRKYIKGLELAQKKK